MSDTPDAPEIIGTAEAAEILDTHPATVNRLAAAGDLAVAAKAPGRRGARLYRRADVEQLAEARRLAALARREAVTA